MDNMEHTYRTLGKFLAIASAVRVYKEIYSGDVPQIEIIRIFNELQIISDDYLYPKYIISKNRLDYLLEVEDTNDVEIINNNDVGC